MRDRHVLTTITTMPFGAPASLLGKIDSDAKKEKRSRSAQIAWICEQWYRRKRGDAK